MLLNSDLVLDQARALAGRVLCRRPPTATTRRRWSRAPTASPSAATPTPTSWPAASPSSKTSPPSSAAAPTTPRPSTCPIPMPDGHDPAQGAALVDYCHVLLNLNEFVFVD